MLQFISKTQGIIRWTAQTAGRKNQHMASKQLKKKNKAVLISGIIVLVVFSAALYYFNSNAGIGALVISCILAIWLKISFDKDTETFEEYARTVATGLDETSRFFIQNTKFPLAVVNKEDSILWFNHGFKEIFHDAAIMETSFTELTGMRYSDFVKEKPHLRGKDEKDEEIFKVVKHKDRVYKVMSSWQGGKEKDNILLCWLDNSELDALRQEHENAKTCYAYVNIDNYDELISPTTEEKRGVLIDQIEAILRQWLVRINGTMIRYKSGRYLMLFEYKYLMDMETVKFALLDEVRAVETEADFPPSLSIGVGQGDSLKEADSNALAALDLALGRGGDQAVVKRKTRVDYYGGKLQTVEKRSKGKSRMMAHALRQAIEQADMVLITGHKNPDMDSFGSALGISRIVRNMEKEYAIIVGRHGQAISKLYEKARESEQFNLITPEEALERVTKKTLLIVVDTHRPSLLDEPSLLGKAEKIVVIDHHRKAEDSIDNAVLTYMESYASSTSELVAEILQYSDEGKKKVDKLEAEAMLAGIIIDTKSFSVKTGARTFEAASWLRRNGADTANIRQLFQMDMDTFKVKATIIADAEITAEGIAISGYSGPMQNIQVIASQAADELLNIKGIRASFVLGTNEQGQTIISARSLGDVNVQTIMEQMGGGGHLTTAGAQIDVSQEDALDELKDIIRMSERNGGL